MSETKTGVIYVQDIGEPRYCVGVVDGSMEEIYKLAKGYSCLERHKELAAKGKAPIVTFRVDTTFYNVDTKEQVKVKHRGKNKGSSPK